VKSKTVTETVPKPPGSRRHWPAWILRGGFAALLLLLLFAKIDIRSVFDSLRDIDMALWGLSMVLYFLYRGILSCQMSLGLMPLGMNIAVRQLFKITLIAGFYSLVLPGSLLAGSAASWYKLSRTGNKKSMAAAALVVYFRIVNTLTVLAIGLVAVSSDARTSMISMQLLIAGIFIGFLFLLLPFTSPSVASFADRIANHLLRSCHLPEWLQSKVREGEQAVFSFQKLGAARTAWAFALSLLANAVAVFTWYLLAQALDMPLAIHSIAWMSSLITIVQMIPVSIGGLGLREISLVTILRDYGISESQALGFSLAVFSLMVVSGLAGGVLEAWDLLFGRPRTKRVVPEKESDDDKGVSR